MWLSIIGLMLTLALTIFTALLPAEAQQPTTVHRIGWLSAGAPHADLEIEAFRQGLRALGYVEGQNMVLESRYAAGRAEQLPSVLS